jgi:hypothetical protein
MADPQKAKTRAAYAARRQAAERPVLIAAYREGRALSCITIVRDASGLRISTIASGTEVGTQTRLWCRRAEDAKRVASAATGWLRRHKSNEKAQSSASPIAAEPDLLWQVRDAALAAACRHDIVLQTDDDVAEEALRVVALIDANIDTLRLSGGFRPVTGGYSIHRSEAEERGERPMRYVDWMLKYRANLVRETAYALRDI